MIDPVKKGLLIWGGVMLLISAVAIGWSQSTGWR